ncbi:DUF943 family protein [Erwinia psidii]|uniref:DUF943 family protein n=1 Tax=Erwinia psidii TaxID=69224 RepID=A0A3N6S234_9GAMM|nr:DUF943 family protein [Erwinia psidii]MCX8958399.1 DUF943 family protein [Erwinia psidii]RQM38887.1 DUF943 family protein [Erwinia psidii]
MKNKKILTTLFMIGGFTFSYLLWSLMRPVEIVAIHQQFDTSSILVNNFPLTDRGKINWWLNNKDILKEKYRIPQADSNESFTMIFWKFGEGYKEEGKYDRLCFDDMKTKKNCIEKDPVFSVNNSKNRGIIFTVYDGTYHLKENGEIISVRDQ